MSFTRFAEWRRYSLLLHTPVQLLSVYHETLWNAPLVQSLLVEMCPLAIGVKALPRWYFVNHS
jgi:hypothetical protein